MYCLELNTSNMFVTIITIIWPLTCGPCDVIVSSNTHVIFDIYLIYKIHSFYIEFFKFIYD